MALFQPGWQNLHKIDTIKTTCGVIWNYINKTLTTSQLKSCDGVIRNKWQQYTTSSNILWKPVEHLKITNQKQPTTITTEFWSQTYLFHSKQMTIIHYPTKTMIEMNPTLKQTLVSSKETRAYQLSAGHYIKSTIHWTMMQTNQTLLWDQGKVLICHSNILEEPAFDATEKQKLGWRHWVSLPKTKYQLTLPRWFIWFLRRDTSDGRRGFNRNSSAPSSKHLSKKKKKF